MQPVVAALAAAGEKLPEFSKPADWDSWIYGRDLQIRSRADRGIEDFVSALILFGNSFTVLPKLANAQSAVDAGGGLTPAALARVDAFIQALDERDDERFRAILEFLRRRRVTTEELRAFLIGIVRSLALDSALEERRHESTTSALLLVNYAFEDTLRTLQGKGQAPAHVRRIALIGAGLDFAGTADHYDFYPPQTVAPFAVLESALRLKLAQPGEIHLVVFDLSSFALTYLRSATAKARSGGRYTLQLPRRTSEGWNSAAIAYWNHFGEIIGMPAPPLPVPSELRDVQTRAVTVKPQFGARISAEELNVVTQTAEAGAGLGFDLVVALHSPADYDRIEQTCALASVAQMLNAGGIFLADAGVAPVLPPELESLGQQHVAFRDDGEGHDIAIYRRR
ncbi:MAG TPA: hypothetical protein VEV17_04230 [Bryobacteraceae bacterium]|nr:hypothetical protein [Bryobacteraceae bacterium]